MLIKSASVFHSPLFRVLLTVDKQFNDAQKLFEQEMVNSNAEPVFATPATLVLIAPVIRKTTILRSLPNI